MPANLMGYWDIHKQIIQKITTISQYINRVIGDINEYSENPTIIGEWHTRQIVQASGTIVVYLPAKPNLLYMHVYIYYILYIYIFIYIYS